MKRWFHPTCIYWVYPSFAESWYWLSVSRLTVHRAGFRLGCLTQPAEVAKLSLFIFYGELLGSKSSQDEVRKLLRWFW
ncbi:hypothetical protein O9929_02445 [Vibrio lentus]|nr:hypothetical protein [Vibrio lentus]